MRASGVLIVCALAGLMVALGMLGGIDRSVEGYIARKSRLAELGMELDGPQRRALMSPSFN